MCPRFGFQTALLAGCLSLLAVGCGDDGSTPMTMNNPPAETPEERQERMEREKLAACKANPQSDPTCEGYMPPMTSLLQTSLGTELLKSDAQKTGVVNAIGRLLKKGKASTPQTLAFTGSKRIDGVDIDRQTVLFTDTDGNLGVDDDDDGLDFANHLLRFALIDVVAEKNEQVVYQLDFADLEQSRYDHTLSRPRGAVFKGKTSGADDRINTNGNNKIDFSVMRNSMTMKENKLKPDNFGFPEKYTTDVLQARVDTDKDTKDDATVYAHVFTDYEVSGKTDPNNDYAAGGVWLIIPDNRASFDDYEAGVSVTVGDGVKDTGIQLAWEGEVTYEGHALGFYSHMDEDGSNPGVKSLTSQVNLTANFLSTTDAGTITGNMYNIALDGETQEGSKLIFPEIKLYDKAALSGATDWFGFAVTSDAGEDFGGRLDGETYTGTWAGMFRGKPGSTEKDDLTNVAGIIKLQGVDNKSKAIIAAFNAEKE